MNATTPASEKSQRALAMVLAYEGSAFRGWQVQPHGPTVQGALESTLATLFKQPVMVYGSGRTDAGVHALAQVAHFRAPPHWEPRRLQASLNGMLPRTISVMGIVPVPWDFHARHSALGKVYRYRIFNRSYPPVFGQERCWWVRMPLNAGAMRAAARALLGTHDFSAFRAKRCAAVSPVRIIRRLEISAEVGGSVQERHLTIEIEASGFLQHMARIITGTLTAVGTGRLAPDALPRILAAKERSAADMTAPGRGLYLVRVHYDLHRFPQLRAWEDA